MTLERKGIAASSGIAIGKVKLLTRAVVSVERRDDTIPEQETERLERAVAQSLAAIEELRQRALVEVGEEQAKIMEAHALILQDPEFVGAIRRLIMAESVNAEAAVAEVTEQLVALFAGLDNEYLRQRGSDIQDVANRLLAFLQDRSYGVEVGDEAGVVLVAHDLHPSDTVQLDLKLIKGFVTESGGRTSHTAIMARARGIPAVVGVGSLAASLTDGMSIIIDGSSGQVVVEPTGEQQQTFLRILNEGRTQQRELEALLSLPSVTKDGRQLELAANIGDPAEAGQGVDRGAEGVGLFRTEFLFMNRAQLPSEEEQYQAYRQAAKDLAGRPLIIRTMDIGGDKSIDYLDLPKELNPFLGYRAIRISLDRPQLLKTQLRAILRASHYGNVKVMFPMVATVEELLAAKAILAEAKKELHAEQIPVDPELEVGIMVETPAAAVCADIFVDEVDFFSIGTNDLIQYTLAADRLNERVANLYQPTHPAILRLIKQVVQAAHQQGKWVGVCGEMAGDLKLAPLLVGLGVDELSMSATSILPVRKLIRNSHYSELTKLAERAVQMTSTHAVSELVSEWRQN